MYTSYFIYHKIGLSDKKTVNNVMMIVVTLEKCL